MKRYWHIGSQENEYLHIYIRISFYFAEYHTIKFWPSECTKIFMLQSAVCTAILYKLEYRQVLRKRRICFPIKKAVVQRHIWQVYMPTNIWCVFHKSLRLTFMNTFVCLIPAVDQTRPLEVWLDMTTHNFHQLQQVVGDVRTTKVGPFGIVELTDWSLISPLCAYIGMQVFSAGWVHAKRKRRLCNHEFAWDNSNFFMRQQSNTLQAVILMCHMPNF